MLSGLRDEHVGEARHENSVMVGAMALMSGMMGAMPAAMVAGMLAVMGSVCIAVTAGSGALLGLLSAVLVLAGRYTLKPGPRPEVPALPQARSSALDATRLLHLRVSGMSCAACGGRVTSRLMDLPGVVGVQVDVPGGTVALSWDGEFAGIDAAAAALEEIGYPLARA